MRACDPEALADAWACCMELRASPLAAGMPPLEPAACMEAVGRCMGKKAEGRGGGGGGRGREGAQGPEGLAEANRDLSNGTRRVAEVARAFASARRLRGGLKTLFTVSRSILGQTTRRLDQRDRVDELYAAMPLHGVLTDRGGPCRSADSNCTAGCKGHTARKSKRRAKRRAPWQPQRG